jgi:NAD(P)H-dependent FMN reductase
MTKTPITPHILVITSTVREGRVGKKIAEWFLTEAKKATNEATFELLDIKDFDLPLFNESVSPMYHQYSEIQNKLAEKIGPADGFVIVTGEYNYSVPGSLKNFLDYLFAEWNHKPVSFVGYGGDNGVRAVAHLVQIFSSLGAMPISAFGKTTHVKNPWEAFDEKGEIRPDVVSNNVKAQLEELLWWAKILRAARA